VRRLAVAGLRDQGALERLARRGRTGAIRQVAVERVESPAVVAWVAQHDAEPDVRFAAVKRTTDQAALERIARTEKIGEIRAAAIDRVDNDAAALRQILERRWTNAGVVEHIARRATDDAMLVLILERSEDLLPLLVAATRLREPRLAAEALPRQRNAQVRAVLVGKVDDRALLAGIARSDPDAQVRAAAAKRLAEVE
jgi:hypothetical protein